MAAVLGGIGIIPGAMWGGFAIGIVEALTKGYISTSLADAVVFVHHIISLAHVGERLNFGAFVFKLFSLRGLVIRKDICLADIAEFFAWKINS